MISNVNQQSPLEVEVGRLQAELFDPTTAERVREALNLYLGVRSEIRTGIDSGILNTPLKDAFGRIVLGERSRLTHVVEGGDTPLRAQLDDCLSRIEGVEGFGSYEEIDEEFSQFNDTQIRDIQESLLTQRMSS